MFVIATAEVEQLITVARPYFNPDEFSCDAHAFKRGKRPLKFNNFNKGHSVAVFAWTLNKAKEEFVRFPLLQVVHLTPEAITGPLQPYRESVWPMLLPQLPHLFKDEGTDCLPLAEMFIRHLINDGKVMVARSFAHKQRFRELWKQRRTTDVLGQMRTESTFAVVGPAA
jgi:hypothetical protein